MGRSKCAAPGKGRVVKCHGSGKLRKNSGGGAQSRHRREIRSWE